MGVISFFTFHNIRGKIQSKIFLSLEKLNWYSEMLISMTYSIFQVLRNYVDPQVFPSNTCVSLTCNFRLPGFITNYNINVLLMKHYALDRIKYYVLVLTLFWVYSSINTEWVFSKC